MPLAKRTSAINTLAVAALASLLFTGCLTNKTTSSGNSDGQAAYLTTELDQMGQVYDEGSTQPAVKTSATSLNVIGESVVVPVEFQLTCECFIRHAVYSGRRGYERYRLDSITVFDSAGIKLDTMDRSRVAKIIHTRNVVHTKGAKEANVRINIVTLIKDEAGIKKGIWNGTMSGIYLEQEFKSGAITNVTRVWNNGRFHFPEAGTLELNRPLFHSFAEFLGDGRAKFKVENKSTGIIHIIYVDKNYRESAPEVVP